jgi:hypothetical protein
VIAALVVGVAALAQAPAADPFAFYQPLVTLGPADRARLDRGEIVARILPARGGEVAVFASTRLNAAPERLVRWTHAIEVFKAGPYTKAIRRLSSPPVLSDLDDLVLDEVDLEAIRRCRAGDCDVKLAADEIRTLRVAISAAGAGWPPVVQREFRKIILERIVQYHTEGFAGLPPYVDHEVPVLPRDVLRGILERSPHLRNHLPEVADGLVRYPRVALNGTDSFMYWSKEHYGSGKPIIAVTQVHIVRPVGASLPELAVFSQDIYASHYRDGSLGSTFIVGDTDRRYLVYVNRSTLDRLGGFFGGLKRAILESRLESEVKTQIDQVRRKLEGGEPG